MYAWFWFTGSHTLLFLPYVLAWIQMSPDGSGPYEFYKYWLGELVISFIVPMFFATELAFIGDIFAEKDLEDFAYTLIEPILIAFFYPFLAFPTAYAI